MRGTFLILRFFFGHIIWYGINVGFLAKTKKYLSLKSKYVTVKKCETYA